MANQLKDAVPDPSIMESGEAATVTVTYDADNSGPMSIEPSPGYRCTPRSTHIISTGDDQAIPTDVTIHGPEGDCYLTFSFFGSSVSTIVTITEER